MKINKRGGSNLAFNDLLFNVLIGFVMLFVIAFLMINPIAKTGDIPSKAEILVTMDWPDDVTDDMDLWIRQDDKKPVGFANKESAPLHLDRDDLGTSNDRVVVDGQTMIIKLNSETITMRGYVTGNFYVTAHAYSRSKSRAEGIPIPVSITVTKINPFKIIYKKTILVTQAREEVRFPAFTVDKDGNVTNVFEHQKNIVPFRRVGDEN
jgi:hypothetical protein